MSKYKYFSPGRINLIGEHVDNFGGHVFPMAIQLGISAEVEKRSDRYFHLTSSIFNETIIIDRLEKRQNESWVNFVIGMITYMTDNIPFGLNITIDSNLPTGAGLSSSAALEVLIGTIVNDMYELNYSDIDIVLIAKKVENEFIGVACGVMDQFACKMGKKDYAMFLDTATLDYEQIPSELDEYSFVIANTNKKRQLVDSAYNDRKQDADSALELLKSHFEINNIAELKVEQLTEAQTYLDTKNQFKRIKHIVTEEERTNKTKELLSNKNWKEFGAVLNESHESLKNMYEVSCAELDTMAESFQKNGALGARMVGAGFGGCVLALIPTKEYDVIVDKVSKLYTNKTGLTGDFYLVESHDGAKQED